MRVFFDNGFGLSIVPRDSWDTECKEVAVILKNQRDPLGWSFVPCRKWITERLNRLGFCSAEYGGAYVASTSTATGLEEIMEQVGGWSKGRIRMKVRPE